MIFCVKNRKKLVSLHKMALTDDQILALYEPAPPRPSVVSSAEYADNKRICLKRQWDPLSPQCAILMYQPSSANATDDDTTIKRCISICKTNGYGGFSVYNLEQKQSIQEKDLIIAWGNSPSKKATQKIVFELAQSHNLFCFVKLKNGNPGLPTRLASTTKIVSF